MEVFERIFGFWVKFQFSYSDFDISISFCDCSTAQQIVQKKTSIGVAITYWGLSSEKVRLSLEGNRYSFSEMSIKKLQIVCESIQVDLAVVFSDHVISNTLSNLKT